MPTLPTMPTGPATIARSEELGGRRLSSALRLLTQLAELGQEQELVEALLQSLAIWFEVDARAYRRDLWGNYALTASGPGSKASAAPAEISAVALAPGAEYVRLSSAAEQARFGWLAPRGDVLVLPLATVATGSPRWIVGVAGWVQPEVSTSLLVLRETAARLVEQLALESARRVQQRLLDGLVGGPGPLAHTAATALTALVEATGAAAGRLDLRTGAGSMTSLAEVGGSPHETSGPWPEAGQAILTSGRLVIASRVGPAAVAVLDLRAATGCPFAIAEARLAEAGAMVIALWLAGTEAAGAQPGARGTVQVVA